MAETSGDYINVEEGMTRVMNNTQLYVKLLNKFKTGTNPDKLLAALEAGDYEKAQVEAHSIKGVAANLSLSALFQEALELETRIKARSAGVEAAEALKTCFAATLEAIDGVLARYG
jgi:two-component system sensor histidine kinase/response regulator